MNAAEQQLAMFGVEPRPEVGFDVFHDESGTYSPGTSSRWLLHGVLIVRASKRSEAIDGLQAIRADTGFFDELHYAELRKSVTGARTQCAARWLNLYARHLSDHCFYHCLAIDTHSPRFQHGRFDEPYHAYNRFTRMALEGAIAWSLAKYSRVALKLHTDSKVRNRDDNFSTYIVQETARSLEEKRNKRPANRPEVRFGMVR